MSEHTEGPWESTSDESEPLIYAGSTAIAMCFDITGDEQKANARLIASSPDLKKLCESVIGFCVNARQTWLCWEEHQDVGILYVLAQTILDKIDNKEALAKAEPS